MISSYWGCQCLISACPWLLIWLCFWTPAAFSSFFPAPLPVALHPEAVELSEPHSNQNYHGSQGRILPIWNLYVPKQQLKLEFEHLKSKQNYVNDYFLTYKKNQAMYGNCFNSSGTYSNLLFMSLISLSGVIVLIKYV